MNKDRYVFAQLVKFLDNDKFRHLVDKYNGDKYVKSYTCWNQLLTLMFGQLSNLESLRDLIVAMEAYAGILESGNPERGAVLQMDQAASPNQEILGYIR